jgi:hypothetical protein
VPGDDPPTKLLWPYGVLVQELVLPSGCDLRVIVAGDRVVGSEQREASPGEWRTNEALGGRALPAHPTEPEAALAIAAARAIGADFVGVDLPPLSDSAYIFIEVNSALDFNHVDDSLPGRNVYADIADALGLSGADRAPLKRRVRAQAPWASRPRRWRERRYLSAQPAKADYRVGETSRQDCAAAGPGKPIVRTGRQLARTVRTSRWPDRRATGPSDRPWTPASAGQSCYLALLCGTHPSVWQSRLGELLLAHGANSTSWGPGCLSWRELRAFALSGPAVATPASAQPRGLCYNTWRRRDLWSRL